jgi:hypothetical protein
LGDAIRNCDKASFCVIDKDDVQQTATARGDRSVDDIEMRMILVD